MVGKLFSTEHASERILKIHCELTTLLISAWATSFFGTHCSVEMVMQNNSCMKGCSNVMGFIIYLSVCLYVATMQIIENMSTFVAK